MNLYPPQITLPPEPDVVENFWVATSRALVQHSNTDIFHNKCLVILFVWNMFRFEQLQRRHFWKLLLKEKYRTVFNQYVFAVTQKTFQISK